MFPSDDGDRKRKRTDSNADSFRMASVSIEGFDTLPTLGTEDLHVTSPNCPVTLPPPSFVSVKGLESGLPSLHNGLFNPTTTTEATEQKVFEQDVATLFDCAPQKDVKLECASRRSSQMVGSDLAGDTRLECRSSSNDEATFATEGNRRGRKNFRERQRRQTMKEKFEELTRLVCVSGSDSNDKDSSVGMRSKAKMKKMDVLSKAIVTIKDLQEQVQALRDQRCKMESLLREAPSLVPNNNTSSGPNVMDIQLGIAPTAAQWG